MYISRVGIMYFKNFFIGYFSLPSSALILYTLRFDTLKNILQFAKNMLLFSFFSTLRLKFVCCFRSRAMTFDCYALGRNTKAQRIKTERQRCCFRRRNPKGFGLQPAASALRPAGTRSLVAFFFFFCQSRRQFEFIAPNC